MKKPTTKSPITDKPLRYPAQSLDEKLDDLITGKVLVYIVAPIMFFVEAFNAWTYTIRGSIPDPKIMTIIAILVLVFSLYKLYKLYNSLKSFRQGRDGEREVGMNLELLRENGLKVYHDIVGKDFNIDHILVGEQGIFVIETKTYSKPLQGKCEIIFNGEAISKNGTLENDKPIRQVKANAQWLKDYLKAV